MFRPAWNGVYGQNSRIRKLLNDFFTLKNQLLHIRGGHVGIQCASISSRPVSCNRVKYTNTRNDVKFGPFSTRGLSNDSDSKDCISGPGSGNHLESEEPIAARLEEVSSEDGKQVNDSQSDAILTDNSSDNNGSDGNDSQATWVEDDGIVIYTDKEFLTKRHQKNLHLTGHQAIEEDSDAVSSPDQFNLRSLLQNIQRQRDEREKKDQRPPRTSVVSVEELVELLKKDSAMDVCVIAVPPEMDYVEYFVICSGTGSRHIGRMADHLAEELRLVKLGPTGRRIRVEGRKSHEWMALDMGTMVVHFMTESKREEMELEKLWTLGEQYDDQSRALAKNYEEVMEMENK